MFFEREDRHQKTSRSGSCGYRLFQWNSFKSAPLVLTDTDHSPPTVGIKDVCVRERARRITTRCRSQTAEKETENRERERIERRVFEPLMGKIETNGGEASPMCIVEYDGDIDPAWIERTMTILEKASWRPDCSLENIFPTKVLSKLLRDCQKLLHKEPTVVDIEVPSDGRINIVGDTHGQFHDVLTLLRSAGNPSEKNLFVFNGDFVDRGAWGVEVLSTFLSWKVRNTLELTHTHALLFYTFG